MSLLTIVALDQSARVSHCHLSCLMFVVVVFFCSVFGRNPAITLLQEKYPKVSNMKLVTCERSKRHFVAEKLFVNYRGEIN